MSPKNSAVVCDSRVEVLERKLDSSIGTIFNTSNMVDDGGGIQYATLLGEACLNNDLHSGDEKNN